MTVRHDPAVRFWLRYAEAEGSLCDDGTDSALVILPPQLQATFAFPEEVVVTADPELAREDGALLLVAGHPALDRAAAEVIDRGDVGHAYLPWPRSALPDASSLLARAREHFPVGHGRIDLAGETGLGYAPVIRVGVLVSYAVSLEDRFQEREEIWVDGRSGLPLSADSSTRLSRGDWRPVPEPGHGELAADLPSAVAGASRSVEQRVSSRAAALAAQCSRARQDELDRADAYYRSALQSIARRRATAAPDRCRMLDAQAEATEGERSRRLRDIEEKFRPSHQLRPFRLHVLGVPALELPVVIRRGARTYPFALTWLLPARAFVEVGCPQCGEAGAGLVAGRDRLGCARCLPPGGARPRPATLQAARGDSP